MLSQACFGLVAQHARMDLAFPMDGPVTEERLLSLFDPLFDASSGFHGHGTAIFFTPRADGGAPVVAPTPDGRSVRAGGVALHDFLPRRWMLPRNATLPVEADYGAPVMADKLPFTVTLQGPAGATVVDWAAHPWERVVADGHASPPAVLRVSDGAGGFADVHVQCGWAPDDGAAGIYLYRNKRLGTVLPHVYRLDTSDACVVRVACASRGGCQRTLKQKGHAALCALFGGASPITHAHLWRYTASQLEPLLGKKHDCARILRRAGVARGKRGLFAQRAARARAVRAARQGGGVCAGSPVAGGVRSCDARHSERCGRRDASRQQGGGCGGCGGAGAAAAGAAGIGRRRRPEHARWRQHVAAPAAPPHGGRGGGGRRRWRWLLRWRRGAAALSRRAQAAGPHALRRGHRAAGAGNKKRSASGAQLPTVASLQRELFCEKSRCTAARNLAADRQALLERVMGELREKNDLLARARRLATTNLRAWQHLKPTFGLSLAAAEFMDHCVGDVHALLTSTKK
jgi:hypothetical protein